MKLDLCRTAPYSAGESSGRFYSEAPDPYRNDYQRDVGRIVHSKAFRRLAFKTQVLSPSEGDHYRSRLSHTLECTQMARAIARRLGLNETLTEAVALAHDLGHPPFGHQGEEVLDRLMKSFGGFDHNLQNIRIVTLLEEKSSAYPGLNLTFETLAGIAKSKNAKAFLMERYGLSADGLTQNCEAWVADLSDELAYTTHDFDDYLRYHDFSTDEIRAIDLEMVQEAVPEEDCNAKIMARMCVRNMVNRLVTEVIEHSVNRIEALSDEQLTDIPTVRACIDLPDDTKRKFRKLEAYLNERMYRDSNLKAEALQGARSIEMLFMRLAAERKLAGDDREAYLELCDYIAGMTDRFLLHKFNPDIY